jgi:Thiolase, N-terminal domain
MKKEIVIVNGDRTPRAEYNGNFSDISVIALGAIAAKEALSRSGFAPEEIDHVIVGNALQTSGDAIYGARHVGLKAGIGVHRRGPGNRDDRGARGVRKFLIALLIAAPAFAATEKKIDRKPDVFAI